LTHTVQLSRVFLVLSLVSEVTILSIKLSDKLTTMISALFRVVCFSVYLQLNIIQKVKTTKQPTDDVTLAEYFNLTQSNDNKPKDLISTSEILTDKRSLDQKAVLSQGIHAMPPYFYFRSKI